MCEAEAAEAAEADGTDTESKTRTSHKDVGKQLNSIGITLCSLQFVEKIHQSPVSALLQC